MRILPTPLLLAVLVGFLIPHPPTVAQDAVSTPDRWAIEADMAIAWRPTDGVPHADHIEMSGKQVSVIVNYAVDATRKLALGRKLVFPALRFKPNETRDQWSVNFDDVTPAILLDGQPATEKVVRVVQQGTMGIDSQLDAAGKILLTRTIFPSVDKPVALERYQLTNHSDKEIKLTIRSAARMQRTDPAKGIYGGYQATAVVEGLPEQKLAPGGTADFTLEMSATKVGSPLGDVDPAAEQRTREGRLAQIEDLLRLETPDPVVNTMFRFAKLRAAESIFATKAGLLHSPGGGEYYAAIWANDQAEYADPFFGYLGDRTATEAALNSFRLFARFINPDYRPIPSSIISEGAGFWNGAGDRGDMAMISYGAARFALANGDPSAARELWPLIRWCLEFCRRQVTPEGVVASDSDELEHRFPAGKANLSTACLYYDALRSSAMLARGLGPPEAADAPRYEAQAEALRAAIEKFFGATVEGFDTYRYYEGNTTLRAWLCLPLTVGIFDRQAATVAALFSPRLWTRDGLATEAGKNTFWDRSTLYALRGVFAAGDTEQALAHLDDYSRRRLLGEHVPYAVEAYPEGNQRHLSAESALYCRVVTEGLWGIRPTGLGSFVCAPRLPAGWPGMRLANVHAFGKVFDLTAARADDGVRVVCREETGFAQDHLSQHGEPVLINLGGNPAR